MPIATKNNKGLWTYIPLGLFICYNKGMAQNEPEIIEAEVVETFDTQHAKHTTLYGEISQPQTSRASARPAWHTPGDHARPYGDRGGLLGGFLVLALGFVVTIAVLLFSVCILIPFTLLMRLLGVHKHR